MKIYKRVALSLGCLLLFSTYGQAQMTETTDISTVPESFSPGDGIQFNVGTLFPIVQEANDLYIFIPEIEIDGSFDIASSRTFVPKVRFFYQEETVDRNDALNTKMVIYGASVSTGLRFNPGAVEARRIFVGFGFMINLIGERSFDPVEARNKWTSKTGGGTYFEFGAEFFLKDTYSIGLSWNASFTDMTVPILSNQSFNDVNFSTVALNVFFGIYPGGRTKN